MHSVDVRELHGFDAVMMRNIDTNDDQRTPRASFADFFIFFLLTKTILFPLSHRPTGFHLPPWTIDLNRRTHGFSIRAWHRQQFLEPSIIFQDERGNR